MNTHSRNDNSSLSIVEAVETLSNIADLEFDRDMGISQPHSIEIQGEKVSFHTVHWLHQTDAVETVEIVRETFRVILHYLKKFYKDEYRLISDQQTIEGIKTIMVLVGEAAKKIDKYTHFFKERKISSVTDLKEYKQLQEFYCRKIDKKIDEGVLGKWILGLTHRTINRTIRVKPVKVLSRKIGETKHVFVDLDSVKRDTEYELFFMRKEDGSRFFSSRLIRNIKLVCDFGDYFNSVKEQDPLSNVMTWRDKYAQTSSQNLLKSVGNQLDRFYHDISRIKDNELVDYLKMGLMALFLASNQSNIDTYLPAKNAFDYFSDFQHFLRRALNSRDYQKLVAFPPKKNNKADAILMTMIQNLCQTLFANLQSFNDLLPIIEGILLKAHRLPGGVHEDHLHLTIWQKLSQDYHMMNKLFKQHPNGPLVKVLELLEAGGNTEFDSLIQHNIPNHWYNLTVSDKTISHQRIPSPTRQGFIQKANIIDEFKEFLRTYKDNDKKHLVFNFQDRTSWREHFRSVQLEELQAHNDFEEALSVVTFAVDTDFYHQLAPYHQASHADVFMSQFNEMLKDNHSGYFFPENIKKVIFPDFTADLIDAIHKVFFSNKNVLSREARLDFIEITYLFLQLKIIEIVQPDSFSSTCKDGVDLAGVNSALLYAFLKLLNQENLAQAELSYLNLILYGPPILIRERVMLADRFNRMLATLKVIEHVRDDLGYVKFAETVELEIGYLYRSHILQANPER